MIDKSVLNDVSDRLSEVREILDGLMYGGDEIDDVEYFRLRCVYDSVCAAMDGLYRV